MNIYHDISNAHNAICAGGIIAYPTEAVYGLGCDPFSETAVKKVRTLKNRPQNKGLLLIAASWDQVKDLVGSIPEDRLKAIKESWPGPITWVFSHIRQLPQIYLR